MAGDDFRQGLTAVVSVKVLEPQFEGQTKTKLGNQEVMASVSQAVSEALGNYLEEHPKEARTIVDKIVLAAQADRQPTTHATKYSARPRSWAADSPANSPTAPRAQPRTARYSSSRATPQAAPPSRDATASSRPYFRCEARFSTCRKPWSTACSTTRRYRPCSARCASA